jgi:hypothetical protein
MPNLNALKQDKGGRKTGINSSTASGLLTLTGEVSLKYVIPLLPTLFVS